MRLDTVPEALVICGSDARVLERNPLAAELLQPFWDGSELPAALQGIVAEIAASGQMIRERHLELGGGDGSRLTLSVSAGPVDVSGGEVLMVLREASSGRPPRELQQHLENLHRLYREREQLVNSLVNAQETERTLIAADIHDDAVQKMIAVSMRLSMLGRKHPELGASEDFSKATAIVEETISSLRTLMFNLRPPALDQHGLVPALRDLIAAQMELAGAPKYELADHTEAVLPMERAALVYRMIQEAVVNVQKHARASTVKIALQNRENGIHVSVADDGVGFDAIAGSASGRQHIGLISMQERAQLAGGWWHIRSNPGTGTVVEFWVPGSQAVV